MPDLATVMSGLFSGGDMTIFQATIDEVGQGTVTVHANGGTFTSVPYLDMEVVGHAWPSVGDACYVVGRKNWGMLVIGRPAPGPVRDAGDAQTMTWGPSALTRVIKSNGAQVAPIGSTVSISPQATGNRAAYHYALNDAPALPGNALATANFYLEMPSFTSSDGVDFNYLEIGLHNSVSPTATFSKMANLNETVKVYAGFSQYVTIPLDWASRLLSGEATGIYIETFDYPAVVDGPGTIRLTTL